MRKRLLLVGVMLGAARCGGEGDVEPAPPPVKEERRVIFNVSCSWSCDSSCSREDNATRCARESYTARDCAAGEELIWFKAGRDVGCASPCAICSCTETTTECVP